MATKHQMIETDICAVRKSLHRELRTDQNDLAQNGAKVR